MAARIAARRCRLHRQREDAGDGHFGLGVLRLQLRHHLVDVGAHLLEDLVVLVRPVAVQRDLDVRLAVTVVDETLAFARGERPEVGEALTLVGTAPVTLGRPLIDATTIASLANPPALVELFAELVARR